MTEKQIKQNAEEYATSQYGEYDEHDYTDHSGRNMCHAVSEKAFIAGAHSRDKEIKELKQKLHEEKDFGDFKDTQINSLKDQLRNPWISVNDRLPEEGKDVFVRKTCTNGIFHLTGKVLNGGKWYCYGFGWQDSGVITHWMPIQV